MSDNQCFVCGFNNDHALERHHIIPESLNGPDTEENTEWLCANCHRAISTMYSKWFFAKLWRLFDDMDSPPKLVRQNPPMGFKYNDDHELVPDDHDILNEVVKAIKLYERGETYREIASRTDISMGKVQDLDKHRELYLQYADGELESKTDLSKFQNATHD